MSFCIILPIFSCLSKKNQKNPLGWAFLKKPGFFWTLMDGIEEDFKETV